MDTAPTTGVTSKLPSLPLAGGCLCGAIRYEIGAYPLLLYACHCTNCQRQSGSAFAMNMPVAASAFRIVRGEPKGWRRLSPSGAEAISWFCADCAGRIHGSRPGRAESVTVRAGSLDDTSWFLPAAHFFMRSAQPWIRPAQDATCYETAPPDFEDLAKAWRSRWDPV
jgi:hypothetical protein